MAERGLTEVDFGVGARVCFTGRDFDLATPGGRKRLADEVGLPLAFANQVHGVQLRWIGQVAAEPAEYPACDALATRASGIGLVIRTADCVPVVLADTDRTVVAAAHVGWRGLLGGILGAVLRDLRDSGVGELRAAVGPAICGRCYQIGDDLAERARAQGQVVARGRDGSARLDLSASVARQLRAGGVEAIWLAPQCTAESADFYSWRGQRATGRQGMVIALPASP
ncbi:MAG: polyphenol oxidase family protein [Bifidobacteriaceae bacterium]|nr:polyphenol oxidase family protein [Bifidobacteriaceae bacterium]